MHPRMHVAARLREFLYNLNNGIFLALKGQGWTVPKQIMPSKDRQWSNNKEVLASQMEGYRASSRHGGSLASVVDHLVSTI